jgi:hypothetical protein
MNIKDLVHDMIKMVSAVLTAVIFSTTASAQEDRWVYEVPESEINYAGERFIIIGDSLSTELGSWPDQLKVMLPGLNLHNWAQGRRSILNYEPPVDIISKQEPTVFVIGSNDYWASDAKRTRQAARRILQQLVDYDMKVVVFLPPYHAKWFNNSPEYKQTAIRNAIIEVATSLQLPIEDLEEIWDADKTVDGIHPNETLGMEIAIWVYEKATMLRD